MATSLHSAVATQVNHIVARHLDEITHYVPLIVAADYQVQGEVLYDLALLDSRCNHVADPSPHVYGEVWHALENVWSFLRQMNQPFNREFWSTPVAEIVLRAGEWCERMAGRQPALSRSAVWKLLAPAQPDHLDDLGEGLYEARWWTPVPMMDIEILKRTGSIRVLGEPYEPEELPYGLALRFAVAPGGDEIGLG